MARPDGRLIPLREGLRHLHVVDASLSTRDRNPFFIIAGSGISSPAIPTAAEIVEHCKSQIRGVTEPIGLSAAQRYSFWFSSAYPQPIDRQRYLESLIKHAKVTPAVLSLAHLLIEGRLAKLVITPNFDDLLVRALLLFGTRPLISDHPYTVGRVDPESTDIQVVHVHGSYYYYDLANLDAEIFDRRTTKVGTPVAVPELLSRVLWDRSPIVLGYAGWPGDVIMSTLERRLRSALNRNLYWFLYNEEAISSLPDWLVDNPNVYFVVAETPNTDDPGTARVEKGTMGGGSAREVPRTESKPRLPADRVLTELISTLKLRAPGLTVSPVEFFYQQVSSAVAGAIGPGNVRDSYYFSEVLERIRHARDLEAVNRERTSETFGNFLDAVRRASHDEVATLGVELLEHYSLNAPQLRELATALRKAADSTQISKEQQTLAMLALDRALARIAAQSSALDDVKTALHERVQLATRFYDAGNIEKELLIYDDVIKAAASSTDPSLMACIIRATAYKANTHAYHYKDYPLSLELIREVQGRYASEESNEVRDALAESELSAAIIRHESGDSNAAAELRALSKRYRDADSPQRVETSVRALDFLAPIVYHTHGTAEEIPVREEIEALLVEHAEIGMVDVRIVNLQELAASYALDSKTEDAVRAADKGLALTKNIQGVEGQIERSRLLYWKYVAQGDSAESRETLTQLLSMEGPSGIVERYQKAALKIILGNRRSVQNLEDIKDIVEAGGSPEANARIKALAASLTTEMRETPATSPRGDGQGDS